MQTAEIKHGEWIAFVEAAEDPAVWLNTNGPAFLPPAKARELAQALIQQAAEAERMAVPDGVKNALIRSALKARARKWTDEPITGFGTGELS